MNREELRDEFLAALRRTGEETLATNPILAPLKASYDEYQDRKKAEEAAVAQQMIAGADPSFAGRPEEASLGEEGFFDLVKPYKEAALARSGLPPWAQTVGDVLLPDNPSDLFDLVQMGRSGVRRMGDVIDLKKMRSKLKAEKIAKGIEEAPRTFKDKGKQAFEELFKKDKGPGSLSGNLGKTSKEMMAENNMRAMREAGLDTPGRGKFLDEPKPLVDKDLNIARNKVDNEYEKIMEGDDYGGNSYMPSGKFKEVPPSNEMSFEDFAKAIEQKRQFHPEDAMSSQLERDRWDIFRAQANMADKSEAADRLEKMAGKYAEDPAIADQIDSLRRQSKSWQDRSESWAEDLSDLEKRIAAGEKIPGINRGPLTFEEELQDFAKRAGNDGSFETEKEAADWYRKHHAPEVVEKRQQKYEKKRKNEKLESQFRRSDEYENAIKASQGRDEVTWPRRDIGELEGPVKFAGSRDNKLSIADPNTPRDWESYAMALERGDKVRSPLEALSDEELAKFQVFAGQAKALDQMAIREELLRRMKKGGDLYPIKNRVTLKNVLERLDSEAKRGLSPYAPGWGMRRKDPWNIEE